MGKQWKQWETIFWGSKITADGDCSHEIKRRLLLGRKVMTNLDSILKSRDIVLLTKVHLVKAMAFPVVMYGCESCTIKKAEHWRIDAFWTVMLDISELWYSGSFFLENGIKNHILGARGTHCYWIVFRTFQKTEEIYTCILILYMHTYLYIFLYVTIYSLKVDTSPYWYLQL